MFTETSLSYIVISTHAPRTGSDPVAPAPADKPAAFQPTLPARGATYFSAEWYTLSIYFNPRSPHGERLSG